MFPTNLARLCCNRPLKSSIPGDIWGHSRSTTRCTAWDPLPSDPILTTISSRGCELEVGHYQPSRDSSQRYALPDMHKKSSPDHSSFHSTPQLHTLRFDNATAQSKCNFIYQLLKYRPLMFIGTDPDYQRVGTAGNYRAAHYGDHE